MEKLSISEREVRFDENYARVRAELGAAAERSGRSAEEVTLVAATKTVPAELINRAIAAGVTDIGENRAQEYLSKIGELLPCRRHFIGHLQTNKVRDIADKVDMIQSVDSVKLAGEISRVCGRIGREMDILLEVNIGREESKSGFSPEELPAAFGDIASLEHIRVRGLMAIPPVCGDPAEAKKYFSQMNKLFVEIKSVCGYNSGVDYLSMGMSSDYAAAVECGANMVRVGTALFGARS